MKNVTKNKGVTLIALVITIIVLLILASVSITTLFGQDGIITKGQEAARKTEDAAKNEQEFLNYAEDYMESVSKAIGDKMTAAGIQGNPESLRDVVDGVPIPKGFKVSSVATERTKEEGLVIIDDKGNEFVWVPVKDLAENGTIDGSGTDNQRFGRRLFGRTELLGGTSPVAGKYTEVLPLALTKSVEDYGGFYIARYEASYNNGKVASKPSTTVTANYGSWTPTNGILWNLITNSDATTRCEEMYGSEAKVVAHLPFGAEWDTTLQWFKETVTEFGNENTLIGANSTSWGNYVNVTINTVSSGQKWVDDPRLFNTGVETIPANRHMINNIYDIAGNLEEWTQEGYGVSAYVARGGNFDKFGTGLPAACRNGTAEWEAGYTGFRPALYIK